MPSKTLTCSYNVPKHMNNKIYEWTKLKLCKKNGNYMAPKKFTVVEAFIFTMMDFGQV